MNYGIRFFLSALVLLAVFGAVVSGCGDDGDGGDDNATALPPSAIAKVDDATLSRAELKRRIGIFQASLGTTGQKLTPQLKKQLVDGMIYAQWLELEGADQGLLPTDAEVRKALRLRDQRVGIGIPNPDGDIVFEKTRADHVRLDLLAQSLLAKAAENAPQATDAEVEAFYKQHTDDFSVAERRDVYLVATRDKADAVAAARAANDGKAWPGLVKQYSQEGVAAHGDGLVHLSDGTFEPALVKAIFTAPVKRPLGPVEAEGAWYAFEVLKAVPGRQVPLSDVRESIRVNLDSEARDKARSAFTDEMRKKYTDRTTCAPDLQIDLCGNDNAS